ncbi:NAD(P)/FAD-dependent oxidoreductase [Streptomyces roseoverticillatus]|uniref:D-amino-acid oxidase n=1 Tax=Streptomyces roseoverticillatus TaxID=66429 RepID=A0ABV3IMF3_9ACTN
MPSDAIVVGAGVIGLTTAVVLAEAGRRVEVWSRERPAETTSAVAGGLWWPYRIEPREAVAAWALASFRQLSRLADRPDETGVRLVDGTHASTEPEERAAWAAGVPGLRPAGREELPAGYGHGLRARTPMVDMPAYLGYLQRRFAAAGGTVVHRAVPHLAEAGRAAPVVVNCTGLGARDLVPDRLVHPVQGQVVVVEDPGITEWLVAEDSAAGEFFHVFPQPYGVVLGGTAREQVWDRTPSPATARSIVSRCARVDSRLAEARVLAHRTGLRPARSPARLEATRLPGGARLVHNYGHGGAGVTVSWGCALVAAELVDGDGGREDPVSPGRAG